MLNEIQFRFVEELRTDSKVCNRAWRAFQQLLLEGIQVDVKVVQASQNLIRQDLQKLEEIRNHLDQLTKTVDYRLPNEPFQQGLDKALSLIRVDLVKVIEVTQQTEKKVESITIKIERLLPNDKEDFQNYIDALRIYSTNLPYLALYGSLSGHLKKLDEIFVEPFFYMHDRDNNRKNINEKGLKTIIKQNLNDNGSTYLFIRGQPGSGKSTILRWIAKHAFVEPSVVGLDQPYLPILVNLRLLAVSDGISIEDKLRNSLSKAGELASQGNLPIGFFEGWSLHLGCPWLIMLDGLDEIPKDQYDAVVQWIQNAMETIKSAGHYIIITSRTTHNVPVILDKQFTSYKILPFDQPLQRKLLKFWFPDWEEEQVYSFLDKLRILQAESLASTPLLLTIAAIIYGQDGKLPEQRTNLYKRYVGISLEEASKRGLIDELGVEIFDLADYGLEHIALEATKNPQENSLETIYSSIAQYLYTALNFSEDIAQVRSRRFVETMGRRSGIWICQGEKCEWIHSIFREYLAARLIVRTYFNDAGCSDFAAIERIFTNAGSAELWNFMIELLEHRKRLGDENWQEICHHALQYEFSLALRYYRKVKSAPEKHIKLPMLEEDLISILQYPYFDPVEEIFDESKWLSIRILGLVGSQKAANDILESVIGNTWASDEDGVYGEDFHGRPPSSYFERQEAKFALGLIGGDYIIDQLLLLTHIKPDLGHAKLLMPRYNFTTSSDIVRDNAIEALGIMYDERCIVRLLEIANNSTPDSLSNYHIAQGLADFLLVDLRETSGYEKDEYWRSYISQYILWLLKSWTWPKEALTNGQKMEDAEDKWDNSSEEPNILRLHWSKGAFEETSLITEHIIQVISTRRQESKRLRKKWQPSIEEQLAKFAAWGDGDALKALSNLESVSAVNYLENAILAYDIEQYDDDFFFTHNPWIISVVERLGKHTRTFPLLFISPHVEFAFDTLQEIGHIKISQNLLEIFAKNNRDIEMCRKLAEIMVQVIETYHGSDFTETIKAIGIAAKQLVSDPDEEIRKRANLCLEILSKS